MATRMVRSTAPHTEFEQSPTSTRSPIRASSVSPVPGTAARHEGISENQFDADAASHISAPRNSTTCHLRLGRGPPDVFRCEAFHMCGGARAPTPPRREFSYNTSIRLRFGRHPSGKLRGANTDRQNPLAPIGAGTQAVRVLCVGNAVVVAVLYSSYDSDAQTRATRVPRPESALRCSSLLDTQWFDGLRVAIGSDHRCSGLDSRSRSPTLL